MTELAVLEQLWDPVAFPVAGVPKLFASANNSVSGWQVVIGQNNLGPQYELTMARQRHFAFHVDDSHVFTFQLDGNDPALPFITELVTDVWVYLNGALFYRGRVGSTTDTLDGQADTYVVQVTTFDYREWLARQLLQPSRNWIWTSKTHAQIIQDLWTYCINGQSGIHPTFTLVTSALSTTPVSFAATAGTSVKETISTMTGFGWRVFPNSISGITCEFISPYYYHNNGTFVMEYGGSVDQISRTLDTASYANSTIYTGDMNLAPVQGDASGISTMLQGRLAEVVSNPAIVDATHLQKAAADEAARAQAVVPAWSCHLAPGVWTQQSDAWLGDICRFYVKRGRLQVNDMYRITDIEIEINDDSDNANNVTLTIAKPPPLS